MTEEPSSRGAAHLAAWAVGMLLLGAALYLVERGPAPAGWLPAWLRDSFPSFAHVFAFSLLSVAALARSRRQALGLCAFWLGVDTLLELAQIVNWPRGRFDPFDLLALLLGAAAAWRVVVRRHDFPGRQR